MVILLTTQFISEAIEPPSKKAVDQCIEMLGTIGALSGSEHLTYLGYAGGRLRAFLTTPVSIFPISLLTPPLVCWLIEICGPDVLSPSPLAGKMMLYGVLFRCLDPVLTIAASLSFKRFGSLLHPIFKVPINCLVLLCPPLEREMRLIL